MNKENVNKLIELLKSINETDFDMNMFQKYNYVNETNDFDMNFETNDFDMNFENGCYTPSCIAGYAITLDPNTVYKNNGYVERISLKAAEWLEISILQAETLFSPYPKDYKRICNPYEATPAQAAKVLEYFRDYGIVDWSKMLE